MGASSWPSRPCWPWCRGTGESMMATLQGRTGLGAATRAGAHTQHTRACWCLAAVRAAALEPWSIWGWGCFSWH